MNLCISFLCLITLCCWVTLQVSGNNIVPDCCLNVSQKSIALRIVKNYHIQNAETNCSIDAVVFITKKNKRLCAPPKADWVLALKKKLDERKQRKLKNTHDRS